MTDAINVENALAFVIEHGVVLASARGPAPRLIDMIAGENIAGNWWSHPRANSIYNLLSKVQDSDQVLVCRLVNGKITIVHCRLWSALVRLADKFSPQQIAQVNEEHTINGHHTSREVPFPEWVPPMVIQHASLMSEAEATALIGRWVSGPSVPGQGRRKRN